MVGVHKKSDFNSRIVNPVFLCVVFREFSNSVPDLFFLNGLKILNLRFEIIFGGPKAAVRPVPIPNTAVKRSLADGSGFIDSARVGRRQSFAKAGEHRFSGLCFSLASNHAIMMQQRE